LELLLLGMALGKALIQSAGVLVLCIGGYYISINGTQPSRDRLEKELKNKLGAPSDESTRALYNTILENANSNRPVWDVRGANDPETKSKSK